MTTDWSQFTPVEATNDAVDWSQFAPVEAPSSGLIGTAPENDAISNEMAAFSSPETRSFLPKPAVPYVDHSNDPLQTPEQAKLAMYETRARATPESQAKARAEIQKSFAGNRDAAIKGIKREYHVDDNDGAFIYDQMVNEKDSPEQARVLNTGVKLPDIKPATDYAKLALDNAASVLKIPVTLGLGEINTFARTSSALSKLVGAHALADDAEVMKEKTSLGADFEYAMGQATMVDKVSYAMGSALGMIAESMMTPGGPVKVANTVTESLGNMFGHAFRAAVIPGLTDATETIQKVYEATGDRTKAFNAGVAKYAATTVMFTAPVSVQGSTAVRAATGAAIMPLAGEAGKAVENAALPSELQTPIDIVGAYSNPETLAQGAIFGVGMGHSNAGDRASKAYQDYSRRTYGEYPPGVKEMMTEFANDRVQQIDWILNNKGRNVEAAKLTEQPGQVEALVKEREFLSRNADSPEPILQREGMLPPRPAVADIHKAADVDQAIEIAKAAVPDVTAPVRPATPEELSTVSTPAAKEMIESAGGLPKAAENLRPAEEAPTIPTPEPKAEPLHYDAYTAKTRLFDLFAGKAEATDTGIIMRSKDGTEYALDVADPNTLPESSVTGLDRGGYSALKAIADAVGKDIVLYRGPGGGIANRHTQADTIFVNAEGKTNPLFVLFHENSHLAEGTPLHNVFMSVLQGQLKKGWQSALMERHGATEQLLGKKMSLDKKMSEVSADVWGDAMLDPEFMGKVVERLRIKMGTEKAKVEVEGFLGTIKNLWNKAVEVLGGNTITDANGRRYVERFVKDLGKVHDALADVVADQFYKNGVKPEHLEALHPAERDASLENAVTIDNTRGSKEEYEQHRKDMGFDKEEALTEQEMADLQAELAGEQFSPEDSSGQHAMEIERENRVLSDKTKLSKGEKTAIEREAMKYGLTRAEVEVAVRRIKAQFPKEGGWAPIEFHRLNPKGMKKGILNMATVEFKDQPYAFHTDVTGKDTAKTHAARVNKIGDGIANEILGTLARSKSGDKNASVIIDQMTWYRKVAAMMHHQFGGFADFLAQLTGPTSANTPVEGNVKYSMAALKASMSGKWDHIVADAAAWHEDVMREAKALDAIVEANAAKPKGEKLTLKALAQTPEFKAQELRIAATAKYTGAEPLNENGKRFGMATQGIVDILAHQWADYQVGDAPKTKNYYQNLIGRQFTGATIDVWAARTLRRFAGLMRIPSSAEKGVAGKIRKDLTPGTEFGFGQEAFTRAAETLRKSGNDEFKDVTPADVQAMIWFSEKENWAKNNWTTKIGEGGSAEAEFNLLGHADRARLEELRVAARKGLPHEGNVHPNKGETARYENALPQPKDGPTSVRETPEYQARLARHVEKAVAVREQARREFEGMRGTVDRYVAGISPATDHTPTDATMTQTRRDLEAAVHAGSESDKVIALKVLPTMGRYGYDERAMDFEALARQGYDGGQMLGPLLRKAKERVQDGLLFGRVLRADESVDYLSHRSGIELYLTSGRAMEEAQPLLDKLTQLGFKQFTFVVDPIRTPEALAGHMGDVVGLRYIHTPEFALREPNPEYGGDQSWDTRKLTDDQLRQKMQDKADELAGIADDLRSVDGVASAKFHNYEADVNFWGDYDNALGIIGKGTAGSAGQKRWQGQSIRAGLEGANRRREMAPEAAESVAFRDGRDLLRGDADDLKSAEGLTGFPQFSPSDARGDGSDREGAAGEGRPVYGRPLDQHSNAVTGVHYSRQERSDLSSHFFGTGLKGQERPRVADAADPRIKRRLYFYTDTGSGIRPEADVGPHAHSVDLKNVYDMDVDPLKLYKHAIDGEPYKSPDNRMNDFESAVIDAGYDAYMTHEFGKGGAVVMLGNHSVPVKYEGSGVRPSVPTMPAPKYDNAQQLRQKIEANRSLPSGKMTGLEWKRTMMREMPEVDPRWLDNDSLYYKNQLIPRDAEVQFSPADAAASPEFKKWFGDSEVKTEDGLPKVMYHGTARDIHEFIPKQAKAIFLSPDPTFAEDFAYSSAKWKAANKSRDGVGMNIMPVYVKAEKPFDMDNPQHIDGLRKAIGEEWGEGKMKMTIENVERGSWSAIESEPVQAYIRANHDSFYVYEGGRKNLAVFDSRQIKSASGNRGTYDGENPDIQFAPSDRADNNRWMLRNKDLPNVPGDAMKAAADEKFESGVKRYLDKVLTSDRFENDAIPQTPMPSVLHMLGAPNQWVVMHGSVASKIFRWKHAGDAGSLTPTELNKGLREPLMVFKTDNGEFEVISNTVLTDDKGNTGPVMVVVKPDQIETQGLKDGQKIRVATIETAHVLPWKDFEYEGKPKQGVETRLMKEAGRKLVYADYIKAQPTLKALSAKPGAALRIEAGLQGRTVQRYGDLVNFIAANHKGAIEDTPRFSPAEPKRKLSDDLEVQKVFLEHAANDAGYKNIDDFASNDLNGFMKAAEEWRAGHPEEMLFSPMDKGRELLAKVTGSEVVRDLGIKTVPMSQGTEAAKATTKDYANAERQSHWQWTQFDKILVKHFDEAQRTRMWEAMDEENDIRSGRLPQTPDVGLASLSKEESEAVDVLHQYGQALWQRAVDNGMITGDTSVKYWSPRQGVLVDASGAVSRVPSKIPGSRSDIGGNVTVNSPNLKMRKGDTAAETEALGKAAHGEEFQLVRDIRVMPMAMAKLEKAIAGRELINQIKANGRASGIDPVTHEPSSERFTIEGHPAFAEWVASGKSDWIKTNDGELVDKGYVIKNGKVMREKSGTGEWIEVKNYRVTPIAKPKGSIVSRQDNFLIEREVPRMEKRAIYIDKEWEGPLRAVMNEKNGALYAGMMAIKGKTMGLIMYSPMIHNAVEYGRALPAMLTGGDKGKNLLTLGAYTYISGNRAKNDPAIMREAIAAGLVPIGGRGQMQDITGMAEAPTMAPGRSWTAKVLAAPAGLVSEKWATNVKKGVDMAGKFWHETLLWDRVADLQMGLYVSTKASLINKGIAEKDAAKMAAHVANRYAGALPKEAMSQQATKLLNFALFSRTFTMGNLGVMKDMVAGLPGDVQAQIRRDSGDASLKVMNNEMRKKAITSFALEIGLFYVGNALLQDWLQGEFKKGNQAWLKGYADRYAALKEHSLYDIVTHPFHSLEKLSPLGENEPGKEGRIKVAPDRDGTMVYMRFPFGKIGEEFVAYTNIGTAIKQAGNKTSTMVRPLIEALRNEDYAGRKVWNDSKDASNWEIAKKIAVHYVKAQIPSDQIQSVIKMSNGEGRDMDWYKTVGPLLGVTPSKGAPGGPEVGEALSVMRDFADRKSWATQEVKELIDRAKGAEEKGNMARAKELEDQAYEVLDKVEGLSVKEANSIIKRFDSPGMSKSLAKSAQKHMTEEQRLRAAGVR